MHATFALLALAALAGRQPAPIPCGCSAHAEPPRVVRFHVYNQAGLADAEVDAVLDTARRLWARYGITLAGEGDGADAVALVISPRPVQWTSDATSALAWTLFANGHATPYITLSTAAAERFAANADEGARPFSSRTRVEQSATLMHMLGVALAHEMGHYLLDTRQHASTGILRAVLNARELAHGDAGRFALTEQQQRRLCREAGTRRFDD